MAYERTNWIADADATATSGTGPVFAGFNDPDKHSPSGGWGWPWFERAEADRVAYYYNARFNAKDPNADSLLIFDPRRDAYVAVFVGVIDGDPHHLDLSGLYNGRDITLPDGTVHHVYDVGEGFYCWVATDLPVRDVHDADTDPLGAAVDRDLAEWKQAAEAAKAS